MKDLTVNSAYRQLYTSRARYKHLYGGRGAGRSYGVAQYFVIRLCEPSYFRGILSRLHFADIRGSQFQQIVDIIEDHGISHKFDINDNEMKITCRETGNKIIPKGFRAASGNATAKMKSITEATCVWIEEADEVPKIDFDKLDKSLRTLKGDKLELILSYNTDNEDCFIKAEFHDKVRHDSLLLHTTYLDNVENLHPDFIAMMERLLVEDPEAGKTDVKGLWGGGKRGKVYDNWMRAEKMPEDFKSEVYGLDFGFTNDPTSLVHIRYSGGDLYFQERIYDYGLTNPEIASMLKELGITKRDVIYADSADPKSIKEINEFGFNLKPAEKGNDSISQGIQKVKQYRVFLVNSPNIEKERKSYIWQVGSDSKPINKPIDRFNHAMDAIRYGVVGMLGKPTPKPVKMSIPNETQ